MVDNNIFRCRRCRHVLFSGKDVLTEHGFHMFKHDGDMVKPEPDTDEICGKSTTTRQNQWFISIDDDCLPWWIKKSLEVENWLKGKLNCPKCYGRVGSFDFITTSKCLCGQFTQPAVHVLRSRVDHSTSLFSGVLPGLVVPSLDKAVGPSRCHDTTSRIQQNLEFHPAVEDHHGNRISKTDNIVRKNMEKFKLDLSSKDKVSENNACDVTDTGHYHGDRVVSPELNLISTSRYRSNDIQDSVDIPQEFATEEQVGNLQISNLSRTGDTENSYSFHRNMHQSYLPLSDYGPRSNGNAQSLSTHSGAIENIEEWSDFSLENKKKSKRRKRTRQRSHDQEDFGICGSHDKQNRFEILETALSDTKNGNQQRDAISVEEREELPISDEHMCPVCLDLYCKPLLCYPCKHTFCEPCLRRLARAKPINTVCPLCRKTVTECHKNNELEITLKELYGYKYRERSRSERKFCSDRFYPLPRGRLYEEIAQQNRMARDSRKTWITILLVVIGISVVCFRPVVVNFLSVVDAIVTVISILDLVNLF